MSRRKIGKMVKKFVDNSHGMVIAFQEKNLEKEIKKALKRKKAKNKHCRKGVNDHHPVYDRDLRKPCFLCPTIVK
ncbi:MAG: hypothetical protein Athens101410_747 [Parcubacteria group bacterium Athens1014_10]|nr:MAG: hypothetical protein Athens101410_747 [Parcubacteria group bacterium Athens1014_10]TSD05210.1 MAG: hypothetical protein Athens071412_408 [Parcubacteria group bacterium Athens0714_12]